MGLRDDRLASSRPRPRWTGFRDLRVHGHEASEQVLVFLFVSDGTAVDRRASSRVFQHQGQMLRLHGTGDTFLAPLPSPVHVPRCTRGESSRRRRRPSIFVRTLVGRFVVGRRGRDLCGVSTVWKRIRGCLDKDVAFPRRHASCIIGSHVYTLLKSRITYVVGLVQACRVVEYHASSIIFLSH